MAILNEYHQNDFGRRIDLLVHRIDYDNDAELCGIEFKTKNASNSTLKYQQSKSIRINAIILNDLIAITNEKSTSSIYMDWFGDTGYMVELFKHEDYYIAHHLASLHIPSSLLELEEFKITLKHLHSWSKHLVKVGKEIRLSLLANKRKFDTVEISSSPSPTVTPQRSPSLLPLDIFFTPSNKRQRNQ